MIKTLILINMQDYSNYRSHMNIDMQKYSGEFHFNEQCKQEGCYFLVNGESTQLIDGEEVPYFGIIRNTGVKDKNTLEERKMLFDKKFNIKRGDYINYMGNKYIILPKIDEDNPFFNSTKCVGCNQTIKWKDKNGIHEFPCNISNDSYGVKILSDNNFTKNQNTKANILIQYNEITKNIEDNYRFIFNHSKYDIYEIIDISTSMNTGIITITSQKSLYLPDDDLENNLAHIEKRNSSIEASTDTDENTTVEYNIIGEDNIVKNTLQDYTISPTNSQVTFELDDLSIKYEVAYLYDNNDGSCKITGGNMKANTPAKITAKLNGDVIATKNIYIKVK